PLTLLHRWGGLLAGLVLALLGLSGSLMVWQASLDSALNPAWVRAPTPACPATSQPVAATLELLARHVPGARAQTVVSPREPG
ncbi:PepSY domain-containing protein, partial [Acinetobacter baumannii]